MINQIKETSQNNFYRRKISNKGIMDCKTTSAHHTTKTSLGVSFETSLRRPGDVPMLRRCYVLLRRCHDVP